MRKDSICLHCILKLYYECRFVYSKKNMKVAIYYQLKEYLGQSNLMIWYVIWIYSVISWGYGIDQYGIQYYYDIAKWNCTFMYLFVSFHW